MEDLSYNFILFEEKHSSSEEFDSSLLVTFPVI